jgi:polysaccharide pyruvyl transferase WcaK-like protein
MPRSSQQPRLRFSLLGHFGEANLGDDLLLVSLVRGLQRTFAGVQLTLFTGAPQQTHAVLAREHAAGSDISYVYSGRWGPLQPGAKGWRRLYWSVISVRELWTTDLLLVGPGTLLKDGGHAAFLWFFLSRPLVAYVLGRRYALIGVGVGSLRRSISRRLVRFVCQHAALVTTRDAGSTATLRALGVSPDQLHTLTDVSFAAATPALQATERVDGPVIGLNFRAFSAKHFAHDRTEKYDRAVQGLCMWLERELNARLVFFSFCDVGAQRDTVAFERLVRASQLERMSLERYSNLGAVAARIGECDAFVGTRFHSLLTAVRMRVPVLCLSYERKGRQFMSDWGLGDYALDADTLDERHLVDAFRRLWESRTHLRNQLAHVNVQCEHLAGRHFTLLRELLMPGRESSTEE